MRKFILLFCTLVFIPLGALAQIDTVFIETFDAPSGPDSVTLGSIGNPPLQWNDTNNLYRSPGHSFHLKPSRSSPPAIPTEIWFETQSFSTVGRPYVFMNFKHIAKFFFFNEGRVQISTDNGVTWNVIDEGYYKGNSTGGPGQYAFSHQEAFNEATYNSEGNLWNFGSNVQPTNAWWVTENFDLTGAASDTSTTTFTGYANVRIRFNAVLNSDLLPPAPPDTYMAGWWIDDIIITASPCELEPPKFDFSVPGCLQKPERGQVSSAAGFDIGANITDAGGFNTGIDTVSLYYSVNGATPWTHVKMTKAGVGNKYNATLPPFGVYDTIRWYIAAQDLGCPGLTPPLNNEGLSPDPLYFSDNILTHDSSKYMGFYTFWVDSALPAKCGTPYCGSYPLVINSFPYTIDFEDSKWGAPGTTRGIPVGPPHYWIQNPPTGNYGWTINTGATPNSPYTGPLGDHTSGNGKYAYFEATKPSPPPTNPPLPPDVQFYTPCINLANAPSCLALEFYYHMYGADVDMLRIEVDTGSNTSSFYINYKVIADQQQRNQNDPWQRGVINLKPFVGKMVTIRFRAKTKGGEYSNIAIDDIRLYEPDPTDVIVFSNFEPKNGYCSYVNTPVEIMVINNGCNPISNIPVAFQVDGGTVYRETISRTLDLGDTATFTFSTTPSITSLGNHQITAWSEVPGDSDNSNDTAVGDQIVIETPISTFPYFEDFENGQPLTQNIGNNDLIFSNGFKPNYRWQVGREMTQTRNTGPYSGYHHEGQYLYAASNGTSGNSSTYLRTKCIDFGSFSTGDKLALDFYYHAYGSNISKLEVEVSRGNEDLYTWTTVATVLPTGAQNSEMSRWELKRVDLSAYAGESIKIRFKATRSGSGNRTDFAIDKIRIYELLPNDGGAYNVNRPASRASMAGPNTPIVEIVNFGYNPLQSCTVHVQITPLCGANQTPQTYSQYVSGLSIGGGQTAPVTMSSAGVVYPIGEYEIMAYTSAINGTNSTSGDTHRFNDTISRNIIGALTVYNIPFVNNFDSCNYEIYGAYPSNGLLQWELGTPTNSGSITTPRSSPNAWVTNLNGDFLVGTTEELVMPVLDDFDTISKAELRFYQNIDFGNTFGATSFDVAGTIKYKKQGQFEVLGEQYQASNIGINWMGSCLGTPSASLFGNKPAFVNSTSPRPNCVAPTTYTNGWVFTMFPLDEFNMDSVSNLEMKFEFKSDPAMSQSNAAGGWGIDDFEVYIPPQNSAKPVDVRTVSPLPFPDRPQKLYITYENTGAKPLTQADVQVWIGGVGTGTLLNATPVTETFPAGITRGMKVSDTFDIAWPANLVTSGKHEVCVVTSMPNGKPDNLPADDTFCKSIIIIKEVDLTSVGDSSYCDDFESATDYGWATSNSKDYGSRTSWQEGVPAQFGSAHSGSNAWMTYLDSNYTDQDASALYTPIFIVDSGQIYNINFWHQMESERNNDGGNIEYTLDGGLTWYPIGWRGEKWFNTDFITALDQIRGGWSDTTGGWIEAQKTISFQKDVKTIFRFRFGSDVDINMAGWAIDDFCFSKDDTSDAPEFGPIGIDEHQVSDKVIIGQLAPNPASYSSDLVFSIPEPKTMNVTVYNVLGQMVESSETRYQEGVHKMHFETSTWKSGIYFIHVEYEGKIVTRKLIISN